MKHRTLCMIVIGGIVWLLAACAEVLPVMTPDASTASTSTAPSKPTTATPRIIRAPTTTSMPPTTTPGITRAPTTTVLPVITTTPTVFGRMSEADLAKLKTLAKEIESKGPGAWSDKTEHVLGGIKTGLGEFQKIEKLTFTNLATIVSQALLPHDGAGQDPQWLSVAECIQNPYTCTAEIVVNALRKRLAGIADDHRAAVSALQKVQSMDGTRQSAQEALIALEKLAEDLHVVHDSLVKIITHIEEKHKVMTTPFKGIADKLLTAFKDSLARIEAAQTLLRSYAG